MNVKKTRHSTFSLFFSGEATLWIDNALSSKLITYVKTFFLLSIFKMGDIVFLNVMVISIYRPLHLLKNIDSSFHWFWITDFPILKLTLNFVRNKFILVKTMEIHFKIDSGATYVIQGGKIKSAEF